MWERLGPHIISSGQLKMQKVKAHLGTEKNRDGTIAWQHYVGNGFADLFAGLAAKAAQRPFENFAAQIRQIESRAFCVLKRLAVIEATATSEQPLLVKPPARRLPCKLTDVFANDFCGERAKQQGHDVIGAAGRGTRCRKCGLWKPNKNFSEWLEEPCRPGAAQNQSESEDTEENEEPQQQPQRTQPSQEHLQDTGGDEGQQEQEHANSQSLQDDEPSAPPQELEETPEGAGVASQGSPDHSVEQTNGAQEAPHKRRRLRHKTTPKRWHAEIEAAAPPSVTNAAGASGSNKVRRRLRAKTRAEPDSGPEADAIGFAENAVAETDLEERNASQAPPDEDADQSMLGQQGGDQVDGPEANPFEEEAPEDCFDDAFLEAGFAEELAAFQEPPDENASGERPEEQGENPEHLVTRIKAVQMRAALRRETAARNSHNKMVMRGACRLLREDAEGKQREDRPSPPVNSRRQRRRHARTPFGIPAFCKEARPAEPPEWIQDFVADSHRLICAGGAVACVQCGAIATFPSRRSALIAPCPGKQKGASSLQRAKRLASGTFFDELDASAKRAKKEDEERRWPDGVNASSRRCAFGIAHRDGKWGWR